MAHFGDIVPRWTAGHSQLREILTDLYDEKPFAKQLAKDSGIDWGNIEAGHSMRTTWGSIVNEARLQGLLGKIVENASRQYPSHADALGRAIAGTNPVVEAPTNIREQPWHTELPSDQLEKVIGSQSTLLPIGFLELGLQRARSVCRVVRSDNESGTGFLVAGNLLVTNNHVLPSLNVAADAFVEFNFERSIANLDKPVTRIKCRPDMGFATNPGKQQDWTVVRLEGDVNSQWGAIPFSPGKVAKENRVIIIQHPAGGPKQIALTHNMVTYADEHIVQYLTDTMPGSSGAPVFNEAWEIVALHHSGGWLREPGTKEPLYRNEGIAIQSVLNGSRDLLQT